jgi:hypothetical protein
MKHPLLSKLPRAQKHLLYFTLLAIVLIDLISKWQSGGFTGLLSFKLEIEIILVYLLIYFNPLGTRLILSAIMLYLIYHISMDTFLYETTSLSRKFAFKYLIPTDNRMWLFLIHLGFYSFLLVTTLFRKERKRS